MEHAETQQDYQQSNERQLVGLLLTYGAEVLGEADCEPCFFASPNAERIWAIASDGKAQTPQELLDALYRDAQAERLSSYAGEALVSVAAGSGVLLGRLIRRAYARRIASVRTEQLAHQLAADETTLEHAINAHRELAAWLEELAR